MYYKQFRIITEISILITGAAGFIGANLARYFVSKRLKYILL